MFMAFGDEWNYFKEIVQKILWISFWILKISSIHMCIFNSIFSILFSSGSFAKVLKIQTLNFESFLVHFLCYCHLPQNWKKKRTKIRFSLAHIFFGAKIQILAKIFPIGLVTFFSKKQKHKQNFGSQVTICGQANIPLCGINYGTS